MFKPDFTKTSIQVEREIIGILEEVNRSLDSSNGESERKGHYMLTALISVVCVFASILVIEHLVGPDRRAAAQQGTGTLASRHEARDLELMKVHLARIERQSLSIRDIKSRVAPSMPIDSQLDVILNSINDLRGLEGLAEPRPAGEVAKAK